LPRKKFETALAEFEYCAISLSITPISPLCIRLNSGMALFVLHTVLDEGCRCLQSSESIWRKQLAHVDTRVRKSATLPAVLNSSTNELFNQIEKFFH
jgi:hypothetical protein